MKIVSSCFLLLIIYVNYSHCAPKNKNRCDIKQFDRCGATVFVFGRRSVYLPINEKEMVPHCQEEFEAEDCVKNYAKKCLAPFPRQLVGVLLMGASQVVHNRCKPDGVKEYLSHRVCIKTTIPDLHDCMDQLVLSLEEIGKRPPDDRIPMACCAFGRYHHCSIQPIKNQCRNDPKAIDYIGIKMIKGYASELLDLACQGFEWGGDKCNKIKVPDGGMKFREGKLISGGKNSTKGAKPASLLPPFINIFTKL